MLYSTIQLQKLRCSSLLLWIIIVDLHIWQIAFCLHKQHKSSKRSALFVFNESLNDIAPASKTLLSLRFKEEIEKQIVCETIKQNNRLFLLPR